MEGIHAAGTHLSKCRLKFAAAEGAYGTFMGHQSAVVEAAAQGARRDVSRLLESSNNIPIQDLNYAIFQAAKRGHKYILQSLIDAGGTDLNAAMVSELINFISSAQTSLLILATLCFCLL
jgi:hypothetical protein